MRQAHLNSLGENPPTPVDRRSRNDGSDVSLRAGAQQASRAKVPLRDPQGPRSGVPPVIDLECTSRRNKCPAVEEVNPRPPRRSRDDGASTSTTPATTSTAAPPTPNASISIPTPTPPRGADSSTVSNPQNDRSHRPTSRVASWMHPDFKMPTEKEDLKKLGNEIAVAAVPLRNLKFNDRLAASYIGLSGVERAADLDSYQVVKEMGADESSNRVGALLGRVRLVTFKLL